MPNLPWNEIQDRAHEFAAKWAGETYEKGESQSFWSDPQNGSVRSSSTDIIRDNNGIFQLH